MADFPQSHTTHTTTTTTTVTAGRVHLDVSYIKTLPGILRIVELVLCIIVFICAVSACSWANWYGNGGACGWAGFVGFVGFLLVTTWLLFYLFHVHDVSANVPWLLIELIIYAVWTLFFFIAGIASAVAASEVQNVTYYNTYYARVRDGSAAGSFFAFAAAGVFGFQTFLLFRDWQRNRTPSRASNIGGHP